LPYLDLNPVLPAFIAGALAFPELLYDSLAFGLLSAGKVWMYSFFKTLFCHGKTPFLPSPISDSTIHCASTDPA